MGAERIFLVVGGGLVLVGYRGQFAERTALTHARCIRGASVTACELLEFLPAEIREDLANEFDAGDDEDTPLGEAATAFAIAVDDLEDP